jgi:single-stranded DNA-binding protein
MQVTISGSIGRAPQPLPQTTDGLPVIEAALAVKTGDGKDWFAIQFVGTDLVDVAQAILKGNTIAVTGELTFEPLPDGSIASFKPVVAVSDFQVLS